MLRSLLLCVGLGTSSCAAAPVPVAVPVPDPHCDAVALRDTSGDPIESPPVPVSLRTEPSPESRFASRTIGEPAAPARAHGRFIDLDVKGADIHDVCRLLADVGHANIVVSDDVQGSVTVRMHHVPWDEALEVIAMSKGLRTLRQDDVILVKPNAK